MSCSCTIAQINKAIELRDAKAYSVPIQQIEETQQPFDFSEVTTDEI